MSLFKGKYAKIKIFLLVLVVFYSYEALSEYIYKEKITICASINDIAVIHKFKNNYTIYSEADLKNTLQCISKGVPFYKRKINLISGNEKILNEVGKRYQIINSSGHNILLNTYLAEKYLTITTSENKRELVVFLKPPKLNIDIIKILENHNIASVYFLKSENTTQFEKFKSYLNFTNVSGIEIDQQEVRTFTFKQNF